jgi:hypothetical protein
VNALTRDACAAFIAGADFTRGNMHCHHNNGGQTSRMFLFGNLIAERDGKIVRVTLAGWPTVTTRARLNGLLELLNINRRFYQDKKSQYFTNTVAHTSREITAHEWVQL